MWFKTDLNNFNNSTGVHHHYGKNGLSKLYDKYQKPQHKFVKYALRYLLQIL